MPTGHTDNAGDNTPKKPVSKRKSHPSIVFTINAGEHKIATENPQSEVDNEQQNITINILSPVSDNTEDVKANKIATRAIYINMGLFLGTLVLAIIGTCQYRSADSAAKTAQQTLRETRQYNEQSIGMQKDMFTQDTISIHNQMRQFDVENRAFIEAKEFSLVPLPNKHFGIEFSLYDIGKQPAKIISGFYTSFFDTANYTTYNDVRNKFKNKKREIENVYVSEQSPQKKTFVFDKQLDDTMTKDIKDGYYNYYSFGELVYIDLASNKKKKYTFATEISGKNINMSKMLYNENIILK